MLDLELRACSFPLALHETVLELGLAPVIWEVRIKAGFCLGLCTCGAAAGVGDASQSRMQPIQAAGPA